ncbi:hypothetical protein TWF694_010078 [Orbilia ellipsospora]|uniref:xylan 1,4-beta-xylosidase n=1 Tax=Orbilia ellipsospora TaxID=2528407 RepID=A0AAV9X8S8_9PEZI
MAHKTTLGAVILPLLVARALANPASEPSSFVCDASSNGPSYNASITYQGCYSDPSVSILGALKLSTIAMTPQFCGNFCGERGFAYGGVEFGTQCFCGITPNFSNAVKTSENRCSQKCTTQPSSACGGGYVMSLYKINNPIGDASKGSGSTRFIPSCQTSPLCSQNICDTSLSQKHRIRSLVTSLQLEEKILNLVDASAGAARLGLPPHEWWNEATHGVGSSPGVQFAPQGSNFSYATSFPAPISYAAAFNDDLVREIGNVIGREGRAFGNYGFSGFSYWAPNMNAFRDPRWGRGQETPGEDALRVSNYVRAFVPGLQGPDPDDKMIIATCKHYAAYDVETGRYGNDYNPDQQDLADYFLTSFKACVRDAQVGSIMCAYNAVDGYPSCASEYLLQEVLREHWNFQNDYNYVVSDCGAVTDIFQYHNFTKTEQQAASAALNAGTDIECGNSFIKLNESLADGEITEQRIDQALTRLYSALFTVGFFDESKWAQLNWADVATPDAAQLAYQAAVEGMVLLKNDDKFLPKTATSGSPKTNVAVIGPYATATSQMQGDYSGNAKSIISPLQAFQTNTAWNVSYAAGTGISSTDTSGFAAALSAARASDFIIYLGGIDGSLENEQNDRKSLAWPGNQLDLITQLASLSKPVIVIQFGGGQIDDSMLLKNNNVKSIIWAGYPSQDGGKALLDVLTGQTSIAGRLPITQYPASFVSDVSIFNINLRPSGSYPGKTYRWYTGTPVLPFGYGLHYTTFGFKWGTTLKTEYNIQDIVNAAGNAINDVTPWTTISVTVSNTGDITSDYVGLLFLSSNNAGPTPRPNKTLVSYARLHGISAGASSVLSLPLTLGSIARANADGNLVIFPGDYTISLDNDNSLTYSFTLTGRQGTIERGLPKPAPTYSATVPIKTQPPSDKAYS